MLRLNRIKAKKEVLGLKKICITPVIVAAAVLSLIIASKYWEDANAPSQSVSISAPASTAEMVQGPEKQPEDKPDEIVYITLTGNKYHKAGCQYLTMSAVKTTLKEAEKGGKRLLYSLLKMHNRRQVTLQRKIFSTKRTLIEKYIDWLCMKL